MNENKNMDIDSRSAGPNPNGKKGRNGGGGSAATPTPTSRTKKGATPTKPDGKSSDEKIISSALEAAMSVVKANADELHEEILTNTIVPPISNFLRNYSRSLKHAMVVDKFSAQPDYKPRSIPTLKDVKLHAKNDAELEKTKEFTGLQTQLAAAVEKFQNEYRNLIYETVKLTQKSNTEKYLAPFCTSIYMIADWFVSTEGIENEYPTHSAVMDLFATNEENIRHLFSRNNTTMKDILVAYQKQYATDLPSGNLPQSIVAPNFITTHLGDGSKVVNPYKTPRKNRPAARTLTASDGKNRRNKMSDHSEALHLRGGQGEDDDADDDDVDDDDVDGNGNNAEASDSDPTKETDDYPQQNSAYKIRYAPTFNPYDDQPYSMDRLIIPDGVDKDEYKKEVYHRFQNSEKERCFRMMNGLPASDYLSQDVDDGLQRGPIYPPLADVEESKQKATYPHEFSLTQKSEGESDDEEDGPSDSSREGDINNGYVAAAAAARNDDASSEDDESVPAEKLAPPKSFNPSSSSSDESQDGEANVIMDRAYHGEASTRRLTQDQLEVHYLIVDTFRLLLINPWKMFEKAEKKLIAKLEYKKKNLTKETLAKANEALALIKNEAPTSRPVLKATIEKTMNSSKIQADLRKTSKSNRSRISRLTSQVDNLQASSAKAEKAKKAKKMQEKIEKKRKRDEEMDELSDPDSDEEADFEADDEDSTPMVDTDVPSSEDEDDLSDIDDDDHRDTEETTETTTPRSAVLCKFFQRGKCNRGDKCAFSHEGNPHSTVAPKGARGRQSRKSQQTQQSTQRKSPTLKKQKQLSAEPGSDDTGGGKEEMPGKRRMKSNKQLKKKNGSGTSKRSK